MSRQKSSKPRVAWTAIVAIAVCLAVPALAGAQTVADVRVGSSGVDFRPLVESAGMVLTVSGPDGSVYRSEFGTGESPFFSIFDQAGGALPDGVYNYELSVVPTTEARRDAFSANKTFGKSRGGVDPLVQSGAFTIANGALVADDATEPGAGANTGGNRLSEKTQVIAMDLIVQGSECLGQDCGTSENFGFDTLRLKENNTRIKFDDTSNSGSFPFHDWQLTANDSTNGGANRFSIEDTTAGTVPFTIEGDSKSNTLYVDSGNKVGINTSTPVVELHIADGDSPAVRLEQTAASGFTAQTWDMAGNETNFFVRDVTHGSLIPFKIIPSAPNNSLYVAASGNVGLGTASPSGNLHVKSGSTEILFANSTGVGIGTSSPAVALHVTRSDGTAQARVEETNATASGRVLLLMKNNGPVRFNFENSNTGVSWQQQLDASGNFDLNQGSGGQFELAQSGNLTIAGSLTQGSSRTIKNDYGSVDSSAVLETVRNLPIRTWSYLKDEQGAKHVGPMAEDFYAAFGLGSDSKHIAPGDQAGLALAAIQGLASEVEAKDQQLDELRGEIAQLKEMVRSLTEANQTP